jgi:hypothetical protein
VELKVAAAEALIWIITAQRFRWFAFVVRIERRDKIMAMKYILALAVIAPFMSVSSSIAQRVDQHVYQGGPKSTVPHATIRSATRPSDAFGMMLAPVGPRVKRSHIYNGGPQTVVPHSY